MIRKIKRTEYIRVSDELRPRRKVVLEKVEDDAYIIKKYEWSMHSDGWVSSLGMTFYDGKKLVETGILHTRPNNDVDRYFELCVKYNGFEYMSESENNLDTSAEEALMIEVNK